MFPFKDFNYFLKSNTGRQVVEALRRVIHDPTIDQDVERFRNYTLLERSHMDNPGPAPPTVLRDLRTQLSREHALSNTYTRWKRNPGDLAAPELGPEGTVGTAFPWQKMAIYHNGEWLPMRAHRSYFDVQAEYVRWEAHGPPPPDGPTPDEGFMPYLGSYIHYHWAHRFDYFVHDNRLRAPGEAPSVERSTRKPRLVS